MAALRDRLYSIQPSGNALIRGARRDIRGGLGALAPLPDDVLLAVLGLLPPKDLACLACASRAALAFSDAGAGDLWRAHVLQGLVSAADASSATRRLRWRGGWRETYAASVEDNVEPPEARSAKRPRVGSENPPPAPPPPAVPLPLPPPPPVLYSDLLHASRRCASLPRLPRRWLERENVDRVGSLSREAFVARYERPNLPVIVTGLVPQWPAFGKRDGGNAEKQQQPQAWTSLRALLEFEISRAPVLVGNQPWDLREYVAYARDNRDEMPLYLFDKRFADKAPGMAAQYSAPSSLFGDDLFSLLPPRSRPDWRWLIAGPARSGSTFHVDPNATSAWNAVVAGSKRWVLFPPGGAPPPGVHPSPDGAEVAAPVSILEWYWAFYEAAREEEEEGGQKEAAANGGSEEEEEDEDDEDDDDDDDDDGHIRLASRRHLERAGRRPPAPARRMFECTVRAGELLFVPRGWWHMALNLEEGVAVTHNFVSEENLPHVLRFLRAAAEAAKGGRASLAHDLVSGLEDLSERARLYDTFVARLRAERPAALASALARLEAEDAAAEGRRRLAAAFQSAAGGGAAAAAAEAAAAAAAAGPAAAAANGDGNGNGAAGGGGGGFAFSFF